MATVNYATILSESPNQLRYVSQTHSFQVLGNPQQSNLPLNTILSSNMHSNVLSINNQLVDIETITRCKKQFQAHQSSASTPSYTWYQNTSSGMYQPLSNTIAFSTNSNERLRITSNGNIGIGTTTPITQVHIEGSLYSSNAILRAIDIGTLIDPSNRFKVAHESSLTSTSLITSYKSTPVLAIQNNSKIGIGTSLPLSYLHIMTSGASNTSGIIVHNSNVTSSQDAAILLKTSSISSAAFTSYEVGTNGWSTGIENNTFKIKNASQFHASAASINSLVTINAQGNVGIGTLEPIYKMHINGDCLVDGSLSIRDASRNFSGWGLLNYGGERLMTCLNQRGLYIDNRLEVIKKIKGDSIELIGDYVDPFQSQFALHVKRADSKFEDNILVDGIIYCNTGITPQSSDARLKTNIQEIDGALEKLCSIRGVTYDWRVPTAHKTRKGIGFIAQEVGAVFPQSVVKGTCAQSEAQLLTDDPTCYTYTISAEFYAYLVQSIKELKTRVESLESALAANSNMTSSS